jgi:pyruvate dehydrogenase E2 component (dihydrolipoamide acetyltransferase)
LIKNLFMPKLGMTMEKATVSDWMVKDGDRVNEDQAVLVLETEKAAEEVPAPSSGRIVILANKGEEHPCGAILAVIAETNEEYETVKKEHSGEALIQADAAAVAVATEPRATVDVRSTSAQLPARIRISPLARKLLQVHHISDFSDVKGTGPQGRIVKRDVLSLVEAQQSRASMVRSAVTIAAPDLPAPVPAEVCGGKRVSRTIPLTGMRKIIAERMLHSTTHTARVSSMVELDMTEMIKLREHYVGKAESMGVKITFTDLFIYVAAKALRKVPIINSSLIGDEIRIWDDINIGFAVSVPKDGGDSGLVVPVIHHADAKGLVEIGRLRKELTDKARAGTLTRNDVSGGTFTITNTAAFNSRWHVQTPVINDPEVAILGTSSTVERPVVQDGQIVIRPIMPISFSFDHRVMDGAPAAEFLNAFIALTEDPRMIIA